MKVKLSVTELRAFELACEAKDVRIIEKKQYGKETVLTVDVKTPALLYQIGLLQPSIDVNSIPPPDPKPEKEIDLNTLNREILNELPQAPKNAKK